MGIELDYRAQAFEDVGHGAHVIDVRDVFQDQGLIRLDRGQLVVPDPKALSRALEYASDWS